MHTVHSAVRLSASLAAALLIGLLTSRPAAAKEFEAEGTVLTVSPGSITMWSASLDGTPRELRLDTSRVQGFDFTMGILLSVQADTIDGRLMVIQVNGIDVNNQGQSGASFNEGTSTDDERAAQHRRQAGR